MKYPENERILIVRPCLKAICLGVRSASKLLSVMLYRARNVPEQEMIFTFTCNQDELVHDLCEELTTKQIHDMAIPVLQLLGYLEVDGSGFRHRYTLHLDRVQLALSCYKNTEELELLLISFIYKQLEEVPMELELVPIQLEEVLKHLELLLKQIRTSSNSKRGRKPRIEAIPKAQIMNTQNKRDITDRLDNEERGASPHVDATAPAFSENDYQKMPIPVTYSEALLYLAPHGGPPPGLDAVEIMKLAHKLYAEAHAHGALTNHDAWHCEAWRNAHDNATCADYQAHIDSGAREETPTEPRAPIVTIGAPDGLHHNPTDDHSHIVTDLHDQTYSDQSHPGLPVTRHEPLPGNQGRPTHYLTTPEPHRAQVAIASTPGEAATPPVAEVRQSLASPGDGAATPVSVDSSEPRASGKPKRQRKKPVPVQLSLDGERLKEWYDELRGYGSSLSRRNVAAWNSLAQKRGSDDKETFRLVTALMDDDPWFEEHKVGVDPYWIDRQWENKYIFLQRKKPAPLADKKPLDIYAANSMDKEKMARRIEEMKANAARKGIQVPGHHGTN